MAYFNRYTGKDKSGRSAGEVVESAITDGVMDSLGRVTLGGQQEADYKGYNEVWKNRSASNTQEYQDYHDDRRAMFDYMNKNGEWKLKRGFDSEGKTVTRLYWAGKTGGGRYVKDQYMGTAAGRVDSHEGFFNEDGEWRADLKDDNVARHFDAGYKLVMGKAARNAPSDAQAQANDYVRKLMEAWDKKDVDYSRIEDPREKAAEAWKTNFAMYYDKDRGKSLLENKSVKERKKFFEERGIGYIPGGESLNRALNGIRRNLAEVYGDAGSSDEARHSAIMSARDEVYSLFDIPGMGAKHSRRTSGGSLPHHYVEQITAMSRAKKKKKT